MVPALIFVALLALSAVAVLVFVFLQRGKLSSAQRSGLWKHWDKAMAAQDPHRKVLDADTIICDLLGKLGYTGSMGDRLKAVGPRIPNINALWSAHKLRNRIAHEPGCVVSSGEITSALRTFESVLRAFAGKPRS